MDAYRNAYDAAIAELTEIQAKFEQLRMRKGQVENLVKVLHSIFSSSDSQAQAAPLPAEIPHQTVPQDSAAPEPGSPDPSNYSYLDVPNPLPESDGDPFQRRVKASFRFRGLAAQRSY